MQTQKGERAALAAFATLYGGKPINRPEPIANTGYADSQSPNTLFALELTSPALCFRYEEVTENNYSARAS